MPLDRIWKIKPPSPQALQLASDTALSPLQAQLLINRGISDNESARSFLYPRLGKMADPMLLKDMDRALQIILKAIENRDKITIYGDYDADGLTGTALLINFFSSLGLAVSFYIPSRLNEGYGLNKQAIENIVQSGTGLIITVDCGISNNEEILLAMNSGVRVVVTDHHETPDNFQARCPVINPHQADCCFPFKDLAGVGVAFFLAVAIRSALREKGRFRDRPEPDLKDYLDLVALGTVADRVPLLDQNRILVKSGMEIMAKTRWPGIRAMKDVAGVSSEISSDDLAFRLAPRLNAPGRMGNPHTALKILTVKNPSKARDLASEIDTANRERQVVERDILNQIETMMSTTKGMEDLRTLVLAGSNWHKGVLGIVASRLVDRYHRPSLVFNIQDEIATGSGRSIDGFNLYNALSQTGHLFEKFGGHAHAAGFTMKASNIDLLRREFEDLARSGEYGLKDGDMIPSFDVDAEIFFEDITPEMVRQIMVLSPFGEANPEPLILARSLEVLESRVVGEKHLKLRVRQGRKTFEAIGFGMSARHPLEGNTINMIFSPEMNRWKGDESIQLRIVDIKT